MLHPLTPSPPPCPCRLPAGILMSTKAVLSAPLPRVYEETHAGKVVPLNASQASGAGGQQGAGQVVMPIGGTDFNAEELAKISKETSKKIESEVLAPMERWMNAYNLVQVGAAGGRRWWRVVGLVVAGGCIGRGGGGGGPGGVEECGACWGSGEWVAACTAFCRQPLLALTCPACSAPACLPACLPALQNRMNKLESLRLEVDSRRRTVGKLGKKVRGWALAVWVFVWAVGGAWARRPVWCEEWGVGVDTQAGWHPAPTQLACSPLQPSLLPSAPPTSLVLTTFFPAHRPLPGLAPAPCRWTCSARGCPRRAPRGSMRWRTPSRCCSTRRAS